jgi:hypothetical protein
MSTAAQLRPVPSARGDMLAKSKRCIYEKTRVHVASLLDRRSKVDRDHQQLTASVQNNHGTGMFDA